MGIPGGIMITGPINNLPGYYYNFYNLKVTFLGCPGPREPAIATITPSTMRIRIGRLLTTLVLMKPTATTFPKPT